ncbi:Hypothetical protein FKW44_006498, partial [Caligus rogercresseyi]
WVRNTCYNNLTNSIATLELVDALQFIIESLSLLSKHGYPFDCLSSFSRDGTRPKESHPLP